MLKCALLFFVLMLCSCAQPIKGLYPPKNPQDTHTIYIVSHGWHTGIVLNKGDIPKSLIPEKTDFPNAEFLEIGWGDKGFYQASDITIPITLNALFLPSDSVMHVVGFSGDIEIEFPQSEIIQLALSNEGYHRMLKMIHNYFDRKGVDIAQILRKGLYGDSKFYSANEPYHMFFTCNNWTGKMLRSSGFPITNFYTTTAANVIQQTYLRGKVIRMHKRAPIIKKRKRN